MAEPTSPRAKANARRHSDSPQAIAEAVAAGDIPRRTYRLGEVAAMFGMSRWFVDKLIDTGELGVVRLGGLRVVPADDVERLLSQGYERRPRGEATG
jgi:excisionase family DNA binding protein